MEVEKETERSEAGSELLDEKQDLAENYGQMSELLYSVCNLQNTTRPFLGSILNFRARQKAPCWQECCRFLQA